MEYLQYFFNPSHLFSLRPPAMSLRAVLILSIIFGGLVVIGIIIKITSRKLNDGIKIKAYRQVVDLCLTMGIIGLVYVFFAWQGVVILAGRFILLILGVIAVTWAFFILRYLKVRAPKLRKEIDQKRAFEKYMP